jgi:hypothetical protein
MMELQIMNARMPSAHRHIRQIETGLYLSSDGHWVPQEDEAFDFPDLRSALATYEKMQDRRLEMILVFETDRALRAAAQNDRP